MRLFWWLGPIALAFGLSATGCQDQGERTARGGQNAREAASVKPADKEAEIRAVRETLSPEDQRLVEAQDFCPIMTDKRLGVMGTPMKVMIKDQPVFLCCKGCQRKALADRDKTLAKVAEFKARANEGRTTGSEK